jgi:uncharacterized protein YkwD
MSAAPRALLTSLLALPLACAGDDGGDTDTTGATATTTTTTGDTTTTTTTGDTTTTTTTTGDTTTTTTGDTTTTTTTTTTTGDTTTETTGGVDPGCTPEATELIGLVNAYRGEQGLPAIPASPSLCTVGQAHVVDLHENSPHTAPGCNLHSWSDAGAWTPCCYTGDHAQAMCMWIKPQEMTVYPGYGYENAASGAQTPEQALGAWKGSSAHNDVILNKGIWADLPWKAVGAGLFGGYAVLWFGAEVDPAS